MDKYRSLNEVEQLWRVFGHLHNPGSLVATVPDELSVLVPVDGQSDPVEAQRIKRASETGYQVKCLFTGNIFPANGQTECVVIKPHE